MKSSFCRNLLLAILALAVTVPAVAHHSYTMFDMEKNVTYQGTPPLYGHRSAQGCVVADDA